MAKTVPNNGDIARVVVAGVVSNADAVAGTFRVGSVANGFVNLDTTKNVVQEVETLAPAEAPFQTDDWVLDPTGQVWNLTPRKTWVTTGGVEAGYLKVPRPLVLVVRNDVKV